MGFLLTSYNSLPEQVEANKEKCKDLQTQINNIDTHEIEEVKAQVQTNTQNIANVTQGLGVTNTALNAVTLDVNDLKPRVTNLETKTSNMSKSGVDTSFTESINVAKSINAGTNINADGDISGAVLESNNDNGTGRLYIDEDGNMFLAQALNSGTLITDNNIGQYAPQTHLYRHTIYLQATQSAGQYRANTKMEIINNSSANISFNEVVSFLRDNGYTRQDKKIYTSSGITISGGNYYITLGIYLDTSLSRIYFVGIDGQEQRYADEIGSQITTQIS